MNNHSNHQLITKNETENKLKITKKSNRISCNTKNNKINRTIYERFNF